MPFRKRTKSSPGETRTSSSLPVSVRRRLSIADNEQPGSPSDPFRSFDLPPANETSAQRVQRIKGLDEAQRSVGLRHIFAIAAMRMRLLSCRSRRAC